MFLKLVVNGCVLPREAPEDKAKAAVGVEADGYLSGGVELTLKLNRATQSTHCGMRDLEQTNKQFILV